MLETVVNNRAGKPVRLEQYKGDSMRIMFSLFDLDGSEFDVTGAKALLQLRKSATSEEVIEELNEEDGLTVIGNAVIIDRFIDFKRGRYYYDLQITIAEIYRLTAVFGTIYVTRDISRIANDTFGTALITNDPLNDFTAPVLYDAIEYPEVQVFLNIRQANDILLAIDDTDVLAIDDLFNLKIDSRRKDSTNNGNDGSGGTSSGPALEILPGVRLLINSNNDKLLL